jgi:hypothetical protein
MKRLQEAIAAFLEAKNALATVRHSIGRKQSVICQEPCSHSLLLKRTSGASLQQSMVFEMLSKFSSNMLQIAI